MYLKCDLMNYDLKHLNCKFDVILIEPPLEEYQRTMGVTNMQFWSWDQIMNLDIGEVAAQRSFVFLWCGSSEGLDMGRVCLRKWGFRRYVLVYLYFKINLHYLSFFLAQFLFVFLNYKMFYSHNEIYSIVSFVAYIFLK